MKVIKRTADYTVYEKRSGRYAVIGADKKPINAEEKVKILLAEDLIKVTAPGKPAPAPEPVEETAEVTAAEEIEAEVSHAEEPAAEEAPAEALAEETPAEEALAEEPAGEEEPKVE